MTTIVRRRLCAAGIAAATAFTVLLATGRTRPPEHPPRLLPRPPRPLHRARPTTGRDRSRSTCKLLALNDFHGNLEPPGGSSGRIQTGVNSAGPVFADAGGVEYLATELDLLRQQQKEKRNSITVAAGDLIGASPLLSAAFHDEPPSRRSTWRVCSTRVSAITNSTRAPPSCCGSRTAAVTRSTAVPTGPRTRAPNSSTSRPMPSSPRRVSHCCRRTPSTRFRASRSVSSG